MPEVDTQSVELIKQGYLWVREGYAVRVRATLPAGSDEWQGAVTLKGPRRNGARLEVEAELPVEHVLKLLEMSTFVVTKRRHGVISEGELWVVDIFDGPNKPLVLAEFEGSQAAVAKVRAPWWCGAEVTHIRAYDNENLARRPYSTWTIESPTEKEES
jgi:CYTH domain-containing protein